MRYLVGALFCVLVLSITVFCGEFSGTMTSDLRINLLGVPAIAVADFDADLDIDYTLCDATFGATAIVDDSELKYVLFDAWGHLGAIWFTSYLQFGGPVLDNPLDFDLFATIAGLSIGGVDLYAALAVDDRYRKDIDGPLWGYAFGAAGAIGECRLMVNAFFSLWVYYKSPYYNIVNGRTDSWFILRSSLLRNEEHRCAFYRYGDYFPFAYKVCGDWYVGQNASVHWNEEEPCAPEMERVSIYVDMPFACFDQLRVSLEFYGDVGFGDVAFEVAHLDVGIPFLEIEEFTVWYSVGQKYLDVDWDLVGGGVVCVEPWLRIARSGESNTPVFDGIQVPGLIAELAYGGVALKMGTRFNEEDDDYAFDRYGNREHSESDPQLWCAPPYCEAMTAYDEYYALIVDGESCCGGGFGLSIFNWFDVDDDNPNGDAAGIFGWEETRIEGYLDIGTNATLTGGLSILNEGLNWLEVGMEFVF